MASVTTSVETAAAPQQIWDVLTDLQRYPSWVDVHQGFTGDVPTSLRQGDAFGQRVKVLGMPADIRWTVTDIDAPHRLALSGSGPMGIGLKASYELTSSGSGSTLTWTTGFSGGMVMAVGSQLEAEVGASQRSSLDRLKALVEA